MSQWTFLRQFYRSIVHVTSNLNHFSPSLKTLPAASQISLKRNLNRNVRGTPVRSLGTTPLCKTRGVQMESSHDMDRPGPKLQENVNPNSDVCGKVKSLRQHCFSSFLKSSCMVSSLFKWVSYDLPNYQFRCQIRTRVPYLRKTRKAVFQ